MQLNTPNATKMFRGQLPLLLGGKARSEKETGERPVTQLFTRTVQKCRGDQAANFFIKLEIEKGIGWGRSLALSPPLAGLGYCFH